jgi:hypothetical protein
MKHIELSRGNSASLPAAIVVALLTLLLTLGFTARVNDFSENNNTTQTTKTYEYRSPNT